MELQIKNELIESEKFEVEELRNSAEANLATWNSESVGFKEVKLRLISLGHR